VTVEVDTLAQTSEPPLGDGTAEEVAVGFADPPLGDADGDVEEHAASKISTAATPAAAGPPLAPPLDRSRNRMDTMVADSRRAGSPCQGG
jgi:hypothetical protein